MGKAMIDSHIYKVNLSPEDVATQQRWRRVVCAVYAGMFLVLAAVWGAHQFATPGETQIAGAPGIAPVADASRRD